MAERTWFRTVITMQLFCLQETMNAENVSPSRTRGTQRVDTLAYFAFAIFTPQVPINVSAEVGTMRNPSD